MPTNPKAPTIGKRIKSARRKTGLSQLEASLEWGIHKRSLQDWEQERHTPRGLALGALEAILKKIESRP